MRRAITVKAPDAAVGGGAADPGGTQPAHDGAVNRLAVVQGRFGCVDRQLLPEREAMVIYSRRLIRAIDVPPVALADTDPLQGYQRAPQQAA